MSEFQQNPYAPAVITTGQAQRGSGVEAQRMQHLNHEASVKSIGVLFFVGGLLGLVLGATWTLVGVGAIASSALANKQPEIVILILVLGILALALSAALLVIAFGIRELAPWSRIPASILAGIGLLVFPLGTLLNAYLLHLLLSAKGTTVFSPEYKNVIAQTKHIKHKTSIIVWIFLGLLIAVVTLSIVFGMLS